MKELQYPRDTLIALVKNKKDMFYVLRENWYRIPADKKTTPLIVRDRSIKTLAFYQPACFGNEAHIIRWYSDVKGIVKVKRKELFPDEIKNDKSDSSYYKLILDIPRELPRIITNRRPRRILFIPTSKYHLFNAIELNELYYESPIEEILWRRFLTENIEVERQYQVDWEKGSFFLDFALFCKEGKLGVECDGDTYHTDKSDVLYDKKRDKILGSMGWSILRYTTKDILYNIDNSILQVKNTVNRYGGIEVLNHDTPSFTYLKQDKESQESLFT